MEVDRSSELRARLAGQDERWKKMQNALATQEQQQARALQEQQRKFTEIFTTALMEATAKIEKTEEALRLERLEYEQRY